VLSSKDLDKISSSSHELIKPQNNTEVHSIAVCSDHTANPPEVPTPSGLTLFLICGGVVAMGGGAVAMVRVLSGYNTWSLRAIAQLIQTTK